MTTKNPEYDFKWCPGCGDFGVRRALELACTERIQRTGLPMANNVVIAGIGCSGNLVHLMEGPQPFGFHAIHGRTLPIAMGVKMARPDLNVIVVAGDGDFLSIGMEHIAPQAARNLDITAIIMDNAVYGLTKGQSSPTTELGDKTTSTPFGKLEEAINPLDLYLAFGVSFVAQAFSSQVKEMVKMMTQAMEHKGFSIVHVQSPCTTYNDNYDELKGNKAKNILPTVWPVPADHPVADKEAAHRLINSPGVPLGIIYQARRPTLDERIAGAAEKLQPRTAEQLLASFKL